MTDLMPVCRSARKHPRHPTVPAYRLGEIMDCPVRALARQGQFTRNPDRREAAGTLWTASAACELLTRKRILELLDHNRPRRVPSTQWIAHWIKLRRISFDSISPSSEVLQAQVTRCAELAVDLLRFLKTDIVRHRTRVPSILPPTYLAGSGINIDHDVRWLPRDRRVVHITTQANARNVLRHAPMLGAQALFVMQQYWYHGVKLIDPHLVQIPRRYLVSEIKLEPITVFNADMCVKLAETATQHWIMYLCSGAVKPPAVRPNPMSSMCGPRTCPLYNKLDCPITMEMEVTDD